MKISYTYLMADTANGVQAIDLIDFPEAEIANFQTFLDSLKSLDDGEVIFTCADPDQIEALKIDYAIN